MNLSSFHILRSQADWSEYKRRVINTADLGEQFDNQKTPISFPEDPSSYPCMVASVPRKADENGITLVGVDCCFVYESEAQNFLRFAEESRESDDREAAGATGNISQEKLLTMQRELAETKVLLAAVVKELCDIRATDIDRLFSTRADAWVLSDIETKSLDEIIDDLVNGGGDAVQ